MFNNIRECNSREKKLERVSTVNFSKIDKI